MIEEWRAEREEMWQQHEQDNERVSNNNSVAHLKVAVVMLTVDHPHIE